jgi:hypothetical protein
MIAPHRMAAGAVLLALLGAGCAWRNDPIPPDEDTPVHRACRAEARSSPEVRALFREINPASPPQGGRVLNAMQIAEVRAYRDCLRREGLTLPGGVEPIRPRE